jgi:hypothetical protein
LFGPIFIFTGVDWFSAEAMPKYFLYHVILGLEAMQNKGPVACLMWQCNIRCRVRARLR